MPSTPSPWMRPDPHLSSDRKGRRQRSGSAVGAGPVPSKFADPNIPDRRRLPPLTEKRCYRTPIKPPIIGTLMVHMIATGQSGSSSASMTNRLAMVVIWSDAQQQFAVTRQDASQVKNRVVLYSIHACRSADDVAVANKRDGSQLGARRRVRPTMSFAHKPATAGSGCGPATQPRTTVRHWLVPPPGRLPASRGNHCSPLGDKWAWRPGGPAQHDAAPPL
jgi:hypothetical protein